MRRCWRPPPKRKCPPATTVPEEDLEQLSIENGTIAYATATGTGTVRFTPSEDASYTLNDATDIALRFRIMHRQANRPNVSTGLCYVRFKFVGSDTVWGISKEDLQFTFVDAATGEAGTVRVSNGGGNAVGGQINAHSGTDGTLYIPLSQIRDGNQTDDLGNRLTDTENYESLQIEYIEYTYSAHRWNFAFGDVAIVRQSEGEVTTQTLDLEGESQTSNTTLYDVFYDNVTLKVNGTEATETADGNFAVDLGEQGTVYIDSDNCSPMTRSGCTAISRTATASPPWRRAYRGSTATPCRSGRKRRTTGAAAPATATRSALLTGYTYEGEYYIRKGNHGLYPGGTDELATLGAQPVDCTIEVTVSALTPVGITGDGASGVDVYYTVWTRWKRSTRSSAMTSGSTSPIRARTERCTSKRRRGRDRRHPQGRLRLHRPHLQRRSGGGCRTDDGRGRQGSRRRCISSPFPRRLRSKFWGWATKFRSVWTSPEKGAA